MLSLQWRKKKKKRRRRKFGLDDSIGVITKLNTLTLRCLGTEKMQESLGEKEREFRERNCEKSQLNYLELKPLYL